jgi:hypothetical protein
MKHAPSRVSGCLLTAILIVGVFLVAFPAAPVNAAGTTVEIINPLDGTHQFNFTTAQKSVGDVFRINITVGSVTNLFSWQVKISWDPALLTYVNLTLPADHVFSQTQGFYKIGPVANVTGGNVVIGCVVSDASYDTFNGTGSLAQMYLRINQGVLPGQSVESNLAFLNIGFDTFLLNRAGGDIAFTPIEGHYKYSAPFVPPPPAKIYIDPPTVINPTLIAGTGFNISLKISNATGVNSWAAKILYNKTLLTSDSVTERDFLNASGSTIFNAEVRDFNATHAVIDVNCSLIDPIGVNGSGVLINMGFNVSDLGATGIVISEPDLRNPLGIALPFTTANGYFNNMLIAKLAIDPPEVSGPQYVPGATFSINVTLDDVENLKTCIFNLTYDPSVLQEININVPSVLSQVPLKKLQVDDTAGYIWANLTYRNGVTTFDPQTIMTVEFMVVAMGVSPINLTDVQLIDLNNQPIANEVSHGLFIGLIRDVAVLNVVTDLNIAYQGWVVNVIVTVKNKGNLTETFNVDVYYGDNGTPTLANSTTVNDLDPDLETNVTIHWNTTNVQPCHNYTISATAGPVPYELNLADNNMTDGNVKIRWMGDVNGDGQVDTKDVTLTILAFHTYPGREGYDVLIDLNRDGVIDTRDVVTVILHFNQGCT